MLDERNDRLPGSDLATILNVLGFLIFFASAVAAIVIWSLYGPASRAGLSEGAIVAARVTAAVVAANGVVWGFLLAGVSRALANTVELSDRLARMD